MNVDSQTSVQGIEASIGCCIQVFSVCITSIYNDELARLKEEYGEKAKGNVSYSKIKADISAERSKEKNNNEGNTIDLQI